MSILKRILAIGVLVASIPAIYGILYLRATQSDWCVHMEAPEGFENDLVRVDYEVEGLPATMTCRFVHADPAKTVEVKKSILEP